MVSMIKAGVVSLYRGSTVLHNGKFGSSCLPIRELVLPVYMYPPKMIHNNNFINVGFKCISPLDETIALYYNRAQYSSIISDTGKV